MDYHPVAMAFSQDTSFKTVCFCCGSLTIKSHLSSTMFLVSNKDFQNVTELLRILWDIKNIWNPKEPITSASDEYAT